MKRMRFTIVIANSGSGIGGGVAVLLSLLLLRTLLGAGACFTNTRNLS